MGIFSIFTNENEHNIKKLKKIADIVEQLSAKYQAMSDSELIAMTPALKARYEAGEGLDKLLPDAFAVVREASQRVLGMKHYYVQLLGGIALHQGRIAEMRTGEGKTLVETLPAYLNALASKGVHIVTVNEYLAKRDSEWMGKIFRFLGLSVGVIYSDQDTDDKRKAYESDITYGTNNEFGFDYLRDNMAKVKSYRVQRGHPFAIVDEVDSILIDEARTPLIISGAGGKSGNLYIQANRFAKSLFKDVDYILEEKEKSVTLTDDGVLKAERFFKIENLSDLDNTEINHYIRQALKANAMMKKDVDYIVTDGEVLIVDEFTGRVMTGRRYSEGLHQAIEAKENVKIRDENRTLATITLQNYFRLYEKLSGMTGTAKTEEEEFRNIYNLDVVTIPTNLPMIRRDENDQIFTTEKGKLQAIVEDINACAKTEQPVLVGTVSVEKSEELSKLLNREHIRHNVLNAKNHKQEAEIIAQAGRKGMVTIATNMAGRGTDIMLGGNPEYMAKQKMERDGFFPELIELATSFTKSDDEDVLKARAEYKRHFDDFKLITESEKQEVIALGGLRIVGTERHESRRIDNQLRGRAGRQGDPGSSVFYISLDDDIARIFGGDKLKNVTTMLKVDDDMAISSGVVSKQIEKAQKMVESQNFSVRKHVLSYDDVMNKQREIIYAERNKVLDGLDIHDQIVKMIEPVAREIIGFHTDYSINCSEWDYIAFNRALEQRMLPEDTKLMNEEFCRKYNVEQLIAETTKYATDIFEQKIAVCKKEGFDFSELERFVLLRNVDSKWMDHIDAMDNLRKGIGLRAYGQRNPVQAYQQEGFEMFEDMISHIQTDTVVTLMKVVIEQKEDGNVTTGISRPSNKPIIKTDKIGRNDPCPCGSGKKYKNCCGSPTKENNDKK
ncbi:MAG: preprotein translocase subunit SecA [Clostridia bacterium]